MLCHLPAIFSTSVTPWFLMKRHCIIHHPNRNKESPVMLRISSVLFRIVHLGRMARIRKRGRVTERACEMQYVEENGVF